MDDQTATKNPLEELKDALQDLPPNFALIPALTREIERQGLAPTFDGEFFVLAGQTRQEQAQSALGLVVMMIQAIGLEAARRGLGTQTDDGLLLLPEDVQSVLLAEDAEAAIMQAVMSTLQERQATGGQGESQAVMSTLRERQAEEDPGGSSRPRRTQAPRIPWGEKETLQTAASLVSRALQEAIPDSKRWRRGEGAWPFAPLTVGERTCGTVELRPPIADLQPTMDEEEARTWGALMWEQVDKMGDLEGDMMDLLSDLWLSKATGPASVVSCSIDYLLQARGLKPRRGGGGRRGGFGEQQENAVRLAVGRISSLYLNLPAVETWEPVDAGKARDRRRRSVHAISDRAFIIRTTAGQIRLDGSTDVRAFTFLPGEALGRALWGGAGRQVAVMSAKVVRYHPVNERWPKALGRFLSWLWRCNASGGNPVVRRRVRTVLSSIGLEPDPTRPDRTRTSLEKAFERLQEDGIIRVWQYEAWDEERAGKPGWLQTWLDSVILVEPPEEVASHYRAIADRSDQHRGRERGKTRPQKALPTRADLGERLRERRLANGWSLARMGEELGVSGRAVGNYERGSPPQAEVRRRLEAWLQSGT